MALVGRRLIVPALVWAGYMFLNVRWTRIILFSTADSSSDGDAPKKTASFHSMVEDLKALASLKDSGAVTEEEFKLAKSKIWKDYGVASSEEADAETKSIPSTVESNSNKSPTATPPKNKEASTSKFTGSRVSAVSPAMSVFENVCLYRRPGKIQVEFRSYRKDRKPLVIPHASIYNTNTAFAPSTKTREYPLGQWYNDTKNARMVEDEQVIWVHAQEVDKNPAHCLQDMAFNLAFDRYYRQRQNLVWPAPTVSSPPLSPQSYNHTNNPYYGKWLMGYGGKFPLRFGEPCWCRDILEAAGFIRKENHLTFPKGGTEHATCFRKLLVSSVSMWRYPRSIREDPVQVKLVDDQLTLREDLFYKHKNASLDYPTGALEDFRRSLQDHFHLAHTPWPDKDKSLVRGKEPEVTPILLHIRTETQERRMYKVHYLTRRLEREYYTKVTMLKDKWVNFSVEEQLKIYNQYQYIVTGHGAHIANAIVARPGTHIMEFFCDSGAPSIKYPDPSLTHPTATSNYTDFYGASPYVWFPIWTRRLKMEHFEVPVMNCTENPTNLDQERYMRNHDLVLDLDRVIKLIVNRFGLVPRPMK